MAVWIDCSKLPIRVKNTCLTWSWSVSTVAHRKQCTHTVNLIKIHDEVIKWKHFPRYWLSVWGIHRSPMSSTHKGQWCRASMFSLICAWINGWVNNGEAGDLRRHRVHYDVTVMQRTFLFCINIMSSLQSRVFCVPKVVMVISLSLRRSKSCPWWHRNYPERYGYILVCIHTKTLQSANHMLWNTLHIDLQVSFICSIISSMQPLIIMIIARVD